MGVNKLVNPFKDYLLHSELRNNIAQIIIFSSHTKEVGTRDSNVDILIYGQVGERLI